MGQATANLPDPSKSNDPGPQGNAASADDLLSQLAGEEIDRLLAEADGEPAPRRRGKSVEPAETQLDQLFTELKMGPAEPEPPAGVSAQLDAVLSGVNREDPDKTIEREDLDDVLARQAREVLKEEGIAGRDQIEPAHQEESLASQTRSAERLALDDAALDDDAWEPDAPLPLWLRPLEWINAPLAHCPAWAREAMGKVAILTLINALAVLLYVLLFRR